MNAGGSVRPVVRIKDVPLISSLLQCGELSPQGPRQQDRCKEDCGIRSVWRDEGKMSTRHEHPRHFAKNELWISQVLDYHVCAHDVKDVIAKRKVACIRDRHEVKQLVLLQVRLHQIATDRQVRSLAQDVGSFSFPTRVWSRSSSNIQPAASGPH
jgi:hypothetical protein